MRKSLQIGGAFVGLIVGAGFASGQEIIQFFTSFGMMGMVGALFATAAFAFLGMILAQLGTDLQTTSHKEVMYHIGGRLIGSILDVLITVILFGVAVVMFAGSGATFHQVFGIDPLVGSILMVALTIATLLLNVKNIISIVAVVTPYLMAIIFVILLFSIFTMDISLTQAEEMAKAQPSAASSWFISAILYVSYNIAGAAAMLIVMGGTVKDRRVSGLGGVFGGIMLGALIILINIAVYVKIDVVAGVDMPTLALANQINPAMGFLMSFALLAMMYNTAVGMLYAFTVRFVTPKHKFFKPSLIVIGLAGFIVSLVGFTTLVGKMYATMGYFGIALIITIIYTWFERGKRVA